MCAGGDLLSIKEVLLRIQTAPTGSLDKTAEALRALNQKKFCAEEEKLRDRDAVPDFVMRGVA